MDNFVYSIPTEVYFGKGQIKNLGKILKEHGSRVLLVYGGGSIKKIGIYQDIIKCFEDNNLFYKELSGVEPNPRVTSVNEGARLCKENNIDVILAAGGGSVIDCAKVIGAAAHYDGDAWDFLTRKASPGKVTPIVSILTLSATGSEMDCGAVISNLDTQDKLSVASPDMRPKASILDPTYTNSVSAYQTAAGTADIMSHILEVYFNSNEGVYFQNRIAEALLKTCIEYGVKAVKNPEDYEARANLMWTSSWAINDLISLGNPIGWTIHPIEHELSAFYDITHGVGLAIVTPHWMRYVLSEKTMDKFVEYGVNVWGIDHTLPKEEIAKKAIEETDKYFRAMGIPMTLKEVGIGEEKLKIMAEKAVTRLEGTFAALTAKDVEQILKNAL